MKEAKVHVLYNCIYMKSPEQAEPRDISRLVVARELAWQELRYGISSQNDNNILDLVVIVVQHQDYSKSHWIVHFQMVRMTAFKCCQFHLFLIFFFIF